jgi:hypothetical protein
MYDRILVPSGRYHGRSGGRPHQVAGEDDRGAGRFCE